MEKDLRLLFIFKKIGEKNRFFGFKGIICIRINFLFWNKEWKLDIIIIKELINKNSYIKVLEGN